MCEQASLSQDPRAKKKAMKYGKKDNLGVLCDERIKGKIEIEQEMDKRREIEQERVEWERGRKRKRKRRRRRKGNKKTELNEIKKLVGRWIDISIDSS